MTFLTLLFAGFAALTGLLTGGDVVVKRVDAWRQDARAAAAAWRLNVRRSAHGSRRWIVEMIYDAENSPPLHLRRVTLRRPRGGRIARAQRAFGASLDQFAPVGEPTGAAIDWAEDLRNDGPGADQNGHRLPARARLQIIADLPTRPWLARKRTRLRVDLAIEERTALRRRRTVSLASQEMEWPTADAP